jgi:hypothetical protein
MSFAKNSKLSGRLGLCLFAVAMLSTSACEPVSIHAPLLAGWSPDGTQVALAPSPFDALDGKQPPDSGIWVVDSSFGRTERILELRDSRVAFHPLWSPYDDMLLFVTLGLEGNDFKTQDGLFPFTIWTIPAVGGPLRRVAVELAQGEDSVVTLVRWGPSPGTIIYAVPQNDRLMAVMLNLVTGKTTDILPRVADNCSLEFSPSRSTAALILHDKELHSSSLHVADLPALSNWPLIGNFTADRNDGHDAKGTEEDSTEGKCSIDRIWDSLSSRTTAIWIEEPNTAGIWSGNGASFFYSNKNGIPHASIENRTDISVVRSDGIRLSSINRDDQRLNFFPTLEDDEPYISAGGVTHHYYNRIYSSSPDGLDIREIAPKIPTGDWLWDCSPDGKHILFFDRHLAGLLAEFRFVSGK